MANQGSVNEDRPTTDQPTTTRRGRTGRGELSRWEGEGSGPFAWMRQMQDQIDRTFSNLWSGAGSMSMSPDTSLTRSDWSPAIDVFQRGNDLVVRADVPGLSKDDITVDIADDQLTIRGERRWDHEE